MQKAKGGERGIRVVGGGEMAPNTVMCKLPGTRW